MTEFECKFCRKTWWEEDGRDEFEFSICEQCFEKWEEFEHEADIGVLREMDGGVYGF